jgi:hypothetical protein
MGVFDTMKAKAEEWMKTHPDQVEKVKQQAEKLNKRGGSQSGRGRDEGGGDQWRDQNYDR